MSVEEDLPDWTAPVFETIASTIILKSIGSVIGWYRAPDENMWGVHLVQIEPGLIEIPGEPHEGEQGFNLLYGFDLRGAQKAFDFVVGLEYGLEDDGRSSISIAGIVGGRDVMVIVCGETGEDPEICEINGDVTDGNKEG